MNPLARIAVSIAMLLTATAAQATDPLVKCQQAKFKAQGRLGACLAKSASGVATGKDDLSATCRDKFAAALAKADAKAASAGTSCRFIDNGDDTVSDLNTGLTWQKHVCPGVFCDVQNYSFAAGSDLTAMNGNVVKRLLYNLNLNSLLESDPASTCFARHCDWRVPTVEELRGILNLDNCSTGACIDPIFGPTAERAYWTITGLDTDPQFGWIVDFADGTVSTRYRFQALWVRTVRGGL